MVPVFEQDTSQSEVIITEMLFCVSHEILHNSNHGDIEGALNRASDARSEPVTIRMVDTKAAG